MLKYMQCSLVLPICSKYCKEALFCPEFEPFLVKIVAGHSEGMRLVHEICNELWKEELNVNSESEFSDDMIVKFLSGNRQVTALLTKVM
jgi:hypothetical protein